MVVRSENALILSSASTERMRITSGGLVGIGTTSPTGKLTIAQSNSGGVAAIYLTEDESTIQGPSTNTKILMGGNLSFNAASTSLFSTNGSERMRITSGGNVGIGSSSPGYKLEVNGDIGFSGGASLKWGGNTYIYGENNVQIQAVVNGNTGWFVNSSGRVGIGTTSPSYKLDITGGFADGTNNYIATFHSNTGTTGDAYIGIGAYRSDALGSGRNAYINAVAPSGGSGALLLQTSGGNVLVGGTTDLGYRSQIFATTNGYTQALVQTSSFSSGNLAGTVYSGYYDATNITDMASIRGGKENTTSGNFAGMLAFYTRANGGSDTERMRITSGGDVAINTTTANSKLHVAGSLRLPLVTKSATYTLDATDYTVGFDCTGANRTANLPDATTCSGRIYVIYQFGGGSTYGVTIDGNSSQTINGSATYVLQGYCDYSSVMIQSDGNNWIIISDALQTGCL